MTTSPAGESATPKLDANQLAEKRTVMAAGRTLMAWVRTSLSMYSFGFTIYKILEGFEVREHLNNFMPRRAGLSLIGLGLLSMILGTIEYWFTLREVSETQKFSIRNPTLIIAVIMSAGGVILFLLVNSRF